MDSKEKKINLYCENYIDWIKAKYEQGDDIFVYYNLEKFYNLCSIASKDFMDFDFNDTYDDTNFKKMDFFEKIDMIKDFFQSINMTVDVDKYMNDGTLSPYYINFDKEDKKSYMKGKGKVDNNGNGDVTFPNSGLLLDSIIMAHELGHMSNRPTNNEQISIMSEAVALYTELQFYDYLLKLGYKAEVLFFKNIRLKDTSKLSKLYSNSISILLTYIKYGAVTEKNFNCLFPEKNYFEVLNEIESNEDFYTISMGMNYVFGFVMATFLKRKVDEDFSYTENINILNKRLNSSDFTENLRILGISNFDYESINYISSYLKDYLENSKGLINKIN